MPLHLPVKARIDGVDVILVSAEAFAAAFGREATASVSVEFSARLELSEDEVLKRAQACYPRRKVFRDAEVTRFLISEGGQTSVALLRKKCQLRFGAKRTPSNTNLHYVMDELRAIQSGGDTLASAGPASAERPIDPPATRRPSVCE